jgi:hypothetical protein
MKKSDLIYLTYVDSNDPLLVEVDKEHGIFYVDINSESNASVYLYFTGDLDDLRRIPVVSRQNLFYFNYNTAKLLDKATGIKGNSRGMAKYYGRGSLHNSFYWLCSRPIGITLEIPEDEPDVIVCKPSQTDKNVVEIYREEVKAVEGTMQAEPTHGEYKQEVAESASAEEVTPETPLPTSTEAMAMAKASTSPTSKVPTRGNSQAEQVPSPESQPEVAVTTNQPETIEYSHKQFVQAGRGDVNFFFEGSETDKSGCFFMIEYNDLSEGEYSIITDIANIRTINLAFAKHVLRVEKSGVTMRQAKGFTQTPHSGKVRYNQADKVWMIESPVTIKLY